MRTVTVQHFSKIRYNLCCLTALCILYIYDTDLQYTVLYLCSSAVSTISYSVNRKIFLMVLNLHNKIEANCTALFLHSNYSKYKTENGNKLIYAYCTMGNQLNGIFALFFFHTVVLYIWRPHRGYSTLQYITLFFTPLNCWYFKDKCFHFI